MIELSTTIGIAPALPAVLPSLVGVYVVCLIVGGGLLVISTVFGGHHDADVDVQVDGGVDLDMHADVDLHADVDTDFDAAADVHVDHAADAGVDHAAEGHDLLSISTWFSIRFVVYFAAVFGLVGTVLSYMSGLSRGVVLGLSVAGGLVVGQGVHQTLRALRRSSGDSAAATEDYLNQPARVTIAIDSPARGEVAVEVRGKEQFVAAAANRPDDSFQVGDRVVITAYAGGTVQVVSQQEYEFMNKP